MSTWSVPIVVRYLPKNSIIFHLDNAINKNPREIKGEVIKIVFLRPSHAAIIPPTGAKMMAEKPNAAAKNDPSVTVKNTIEVSFLSWGMAFVGYATILPFENELRHTAKAPKT